MTASQLVLAAAALFFFFFILILINLATQVLSCGMKISGLDWGLWDPVP